MEYLRDGLGTAVIECINKSDLKNINIKTFGYDDLFVKHGSIEEIEKENKLDANSIAESIKLNKKI